MAGNKSRPLSIYEAGGGGSVAAKMFNFVRPPLIPQYKIYGIVGKRGEKTRGTHFEKSKE